MNLLQQEMICIPLGIWGRALLWSSAGTESCPKWLQPSLSAASWSCVLSFKRSVHSSAFQPLAAGSAQRRTQFGIRLAIPDAHSAGTLQTNGGCKLEPGWRDRWAAHEGACVLVRTDRLVRPPDHAQVRPAALSASWAGKESSASR